MGGKNSGAPWARTLGSALKEWCDRNGYKPRNLLGHELGIDHNTWDHLTRGDTIIGDTYPDIYARIFQHTLLPEADPRKIPSKDNGTVRRWPPEILEVWWKENFPEDLKKPQVLSVLYRKNTIPHPRMNSGMDSSEQWLLDVIQRLNKLLTSNPEAREDFYKNNSSALKQLELLAGTLNQPHDERETAISMSMEANND